MDPVTDDAHILRAEDVDWLDKYGRPLKFTLDADGQSRGPLTGANRAERRRLGIRTPLKTLLAYKVVADAQAEIIQEIVEETHGTEEGREEAG